MSDQIDVNQLSNALQQKVDLPANKNQSDVDYVVESQLPTAQNDYTWYRLYKSGWLEQGGQSTVNTVTLLKAYSDTNYNVQISFRGSTYATPYFAAMSVDTKTTTSFTYGYDTSVTRVWEAKGMSAQGGS